MFITHDFAEAIKLGDRIAIMKDGVFDQIGTAAELITQPATDYVREFTKDIPKAKVLTAADVMTRVRSADRDRSTSATSVETLIPRCSTTPRRSRSSTMPARPIGVVDRAAVSALLAETP